MPKAYELPAPGELFDPKIFRLGAPCKRNHAWDEGVTLRTVKGGQCPLCARIDALERLRKKREADPEGEKARVAAYMRERRAKIGRPSRAKHTSEWHEHRALNAAIRRSGKLPSVALLVHKQQLERWRQYQDERRKHVSQWSAYLYAFRYMCDPAFRRHECQRNSERKAKNRGNHTVRLNSNATTKRFAEFDNSCAYCGSTAHLIVEHFIPRAKGGPHTLGNIVPACQRCNVSKRDHDPEDWYRKQPFYTKARWRKILAVLGKAKAPVQQLPLL
jgi:5-methylcytosine-specific restriction endonuclease McrA